MPSVQNQLNLVCIVFLLELYITTYLQKYLYVLSHLGCLARPPHCSGYSNYLQAMSKYCSLVRSLHVVDQQVNYHRGLN